MRARSTLWKQIVEKGDYVIETKLSIGEKEYTEISAPVINRALMNDALSVGNCVSSSLSVSILTKDALQSSTPIIVLGRICRGTSYSEWLEFGTFYINQRDTSYEGLVSISCYDAMLRTNQSYLDPTIDTSAEWPKSMKSVVKEIAYRLGVSIDSRTRIESGTDYIVPYPVDLTMMQVLGYIGACHGGNWIITEENALRLVPLTMITESGEMPESVITKQYYITDDLGNTIQTVEGDSLIYDTVAESTVETINVEAVLGQLTTGILTTISGVSMTDNAGNSYTAGSQTNGVLKIDSNPYAAQSICDMLYSLFNGLSYEPFTASSAVLDPAVELGDKIIIGKSVESILYTLTLNLDLGLRADLSAPNSEEMSIEYPYLSEIARMKQTTAELSQSVSAAAKDLSEQVGNTDATVASLQAALTAEISRAGGAEQTIASNLSDEETRAKTAENALSEHISALETAKGDHETRIGALETTKGDHETRIDALEKAKTGHETRITSLETVKADHETRIKAIEDNTEPSAAITALNTSVETHTEKIEELETARKDHEERITAIENADCAAAIAKHETKIATLETNIVTLQTVIGELQSTLAALSERVAALENGNTDNTTE